MGNQAFPWRSVGKGTSGSGGASKGDPQLFTLNKEGNLMGDESVCLDCPQWKERDPGVRFAACSGLPRQQWQIKDKQVVHTLSNLCLTVPSGATSDLLTLQHCSNDQSQQWKMAEQDWSDS